MGLELYKMTEFKGVKYSLTQSSHFWGVFLKTDDSDVFLTASLDGWFRAAARFYVILLLSCFICAVTLPDMFSVLCKDEEKKSLKKTLGVCSQHLIQSHTPRRAESNLLICGNAHTHVHTRVTEGSGNVESQQGNLHLSCLMNIHLIGRSCQSWELGLADMFIHEGVFGSLRASYRCFILSKGMLIRGSRPIRARLSISDHYTLQHASGQLFQLGTC